MSIKEEKYSKKELAARNRAPLGGTSTFSSSVQKGSTISSRRSNPIKVSALKNKKKKEKRHSKIKKSSNV